MNDPAVVAGARVITTLRDCGVRHVVVAPGSRSAPVARAAAAAEQQGDVSLHVRLDERSAGFLALGLAKVSGGPVAVVCTSGTAVANLFPAVVEARYSGAPLIVITADRPPELRGRGASQTIDQIDIFGRFPVAARDLPVPTGPEWSAEPVRDLVATAVRTRGPVHMNLPLRPPLVGPVPQVEPSGGCGAEPLTPEPTELTGEARGAFVVGDLDVGDDAVRASILEQARALGWPVIAEASSGLLGQSGVVPGGTAALADPALRDRLTPDLVVTVGPFGLDRSVMRWLRTARRHVAVRLRPRTDPPDPWSGAEAVLDGLPTVVDVTPDPGWLAAWGDVAAPAPADWGIEQVAATVWRTLSPQDLLVVASSTAIRALAAAARGTGPAVLANRGANGIDGLVSTSWGAAVAHGGRTVALLGDLAFLHDLNGLLVPTVEARPDLTFVIADNNGGGIFAGLEQGEPDYADTFDRIFATPHDRDLTALLAGHGVPSVTATDAAGLAAALAPQHTGVRAVIAALPAVGDRQV